MSNLRQRSNRPNRLDDSDASSAGASSIDSSFTPDASSITYSPATESPSTLLSTDFGDQLELDDEEVSRLSGSSDLSDYVLANQSEIGGDSSQREVGLEVDVSSEDEDDDDDDDDDDKTLHSNNSPSFKNGGDDSSPIDSLARDVSLPELCLTDDSSIEAKTKKTKLTSVISPDENALLSLPDLTSPEPPLKVTGNEVRRAASLLRKGGSGSKERREASEQSRGKSYSRTRRRRSLTDEDFRLEDDEINNVDRLLKAPTSDYSSLSRSSSPASGAIRQISRRLCDSVTSLDSDISSSSSPFTQSNRSHRPKLSHHKRKKVEKILLTLQSDPSDVSAVRQLAISRSGLVTNDVRALAWPKLLNVDPNRKLRRLSWEELTRHRDYNQVVLDVRRSLRRFPPGLTEEEQQLLQVKLNTLILRVLCEHQDLHYYQGYHDICVTFLLAVGEDLAFALMDRLSTHHLRDFMDSTMERTTHLLNYLLPLVGRINPELRDYVEAAGVGTIFSLSWLITWYGHVLNELRNIVRLYDFFLACHPLMPLYLAAAIVVHRERDIMDTECDFAMLHCTLSKVPEDMPWETLISKAGDYFIQFPPSELAAEAEYIYQKGVSSRESKLAAAAAAKEKGGTAGGVVRGRGGQLMTRNKNGVWVPLEQPKKVAARIVMWTLYASVGAAAYAVYSAGGFSWLWSGS